MLLLEHKLSYALTFITASLLSLYAGFRSYFFSVLYFPGSKNASSIIQISLHCVSLYRCKKVEENSVLYF